MWAALPAPPDSDQAALDGVASPLPPPLQLSRNAFRLPAISELSGSCEALANSHVCYRALRLVAFNLAWLMPPPMLDHLSTRTQHSFNRSRFLP